MVVWVGSKGEKEVERASLAGGGRYMSVCL